MKATLVYNGEKNPPKTTTKRRKEKSHNYNMANLRVSYFMILSSQYQ